MIERTDFTGFPGGRVVILSDPGRCIAVLLEDFRDGTGTLRNDARVAVITGRQLRDDAVPGDVMVAAREQRGACRRAQCGRMEARVAQALRGQLVDIRRRHATPERTELSEARVIEQDQHHVRRAFRRTNDARKRRWIGVLVGTADLSLESKVGARQRCRGRRWWNRRSDGCSLILRAPGLRECSDTDGGKQCGEDSIHGFHSLRGVYGDTQNPNNLNATSIPQSAVLWPPRYTLGLMYTWLEPPKRGPNTRPHVMDRRPHAVLFSQSNVTAGSTVM